MSSSDSKISKVQTQFKALSSVSSSLNTASDELTKAVSILDEALKKLNIGLSVWVGFRSWATDSSETEYDEEQIGYSKLSGKWGITMRRIWGDHVIDRHEVDGPWFFNDAPREMRLLGVDKIPDLIEALNKEASDTTKKIQSKTDELRDLALAITEIAEKPQANLPKVLTGIDLEPVNAIVDRVRRGNPFVASILEHAHRWQFDGKVLSLYFFPEKQAFADMLDGHSTHSAITTIVQEVLGNQVKIVTALDGKGGKTGIIKGAK
jgi:hypothetical protein